MGVAKFTSDEPCTISETIEELYDLLSEIDGIMEWVVHLDGAVIVEYDHNRINEETIEQTLSGIGLRLRSVSRDPNISDIKTPPMLSQEMT